MNTLALKNELLERIARYSTMDVPMHQIAQAVGLDESVVERVLASQEYQDTVAKLRTDSLEKQSDLNEGWDTIEDEALAIMLAHLRTRPDPEYAMKAAALANKATRRGGHQNPLQGNATMAAVINLNAIFVEKLQTMRAEGARIFDSNAKRVETLDASEVRNIFRKTPAHEVQEIFNS